jgi:hypothetical protein
MATRGRPRIYDQPLTSSERKKRWDQQMRNAEGQVPGQPKRTPVVVYLCAEARNVLRKERALAAAAELPAVRDSELIEALLKRHDREADRPDREGLSLDDLLYRFEVKEAAVQAARADLNGRHRGAAAHNRRTILRIADTPRAQPTSREIAEELRRRNNTVPADLFAILVRELRPLLLHAMPEPELHSKVRRQIEAHIDRLLGPSHSLG